VQVLEKEVGTKIFFTLFAFQIYTRFLKDSLIFMSNSVRFCVSHLPPVVAAFFDDGYMFIQQPNSVMKRKD